MATTWIPEQNGNTGRMIFVDNEVIYVDDETHFVDESDVFTGESGGLVVWGKESFYWVFLADGSYIANGSIKAGMTPTLYN